MASLDRRAALMLGGVLAVAGANLPSAALAKARKQEAGDVTANEDLMREHGVLRRILILYRETAPRLAREAGKVDAGAIHAAALLFRDFGEQYHERRLEEQHIFPILRGRGRAGALVDVLLAQHARGREITGFIIGATARGRIGAANATPLARAMTSFCRMYEAHTAREDTVIFPAFRKALGAARYREMGDRFEEIERKQFGGDGFDMALDRIEKAEAALGIADLGRFTAPPPPRLPA